MRSCQALHFWKFGRRFNSPSRKREVHTMSPLYKYSQADILNLHWTVSHLNICYEFPCFLRPLPWVVQSHKRKLTLQCAFIQPITFTQIANHICFFFFFFFFFMLYMISFNYTFVLSRYLLLPLHLQLAYYILFPVPYPLELHFLFSRCGEWQNLLSQMIVQPQS